MRNRFFLSILFLFLIPLQGLKASEQKVSSSIKGVTVFLEGAQVNRSASVSLKKGTNTLVFEKLSPYVDANSIQVKGEQKFTILSVNFRTNFLTEADKPEMVKDMEESLDELKFKLSLRQASKKVYMEEREMILSNKKIRGANVGVNIEDLMELAEYYRQRLKDIEYKLIEIDKEEKKLNQKINNLESQLHSFNAKRNRNTGEVVVMISSENASRSAMELSYKVDRAGWTPAYDLRSNGVGEPVELTYRGKVSQRTGVDWNDVQLTLSTGNPRLSGTKPKLKPWILHTGNVSRQLYQYDKRQKMKSNRNLQLEDARQESEPQGASIKDLSSSSSQYTQVTRGNTQTEFKISIPYTIPSNGKDYSVEVQQHKLKATYLHYAAPKVSNDAFILAQVTGWGELNLLPGDASLYNKGTYVGQSYINPNITTDTLSLSLGRDQGVVLQRKKIKEFTKSAVIGSNRKSTIGIEIQVRNQTQKIIELELIDQIPVSREKSVEVELLEKSGASLKESSGKLIWKMEVSPGKTEKLKFMYSVKYPKDMNIVNF